jgi:hypothetical protein
LLLIKDMAHWLIGKPCIDWDRARYTGAVLHCYEKSYAWLYELTRKNQSSIKLLDQ